MKNYAAHRVLSFIIIIILIYKNSLNLYFHFLQLIFVSSILLIIWFIFLNKNNIKPFSKKYSIDKLLAKKYFDELYNYSHPIFVKGIVVFIVGISERWLLQFFGGSEEQGIFSFAFAISSILVLFTTSVSPIFTSDFSVAWHNRITIK